MAPKFSVAVNGSRAELRDLRSTVGLETAMAAIRSFLHKRWVILYEPMENGIRIRAVIDAARDYLNLFPPGSR